MSEAPRDPMSPDLMSPDLMSPDLMSPDLGGDPSVAETMSPDTSAADTMSPDPDPDPDSDVVVDAIGMRCPRPIIELARAARLAPPSTVFALLASDPAAAPDVAAWCRMRGYVLLSADVVGGRVPHGQAEHRPPEGSALSAAPVTRFRVTRRPPPNAVPDLD